MRRQFKRKLAKFSHLIKPTVIVGIFFLVFIMLLRISLPIYQFTKENNINPRFLWDLMRNPQNLLKSYKGRTSVILLGIAGGRHDGADLTDTIVLLSIDFQKNDAVVVSIPRDIWLPTLKDKINSAYHYGEEKKKDGGFLMAKAAVEEVAGVPVSYVWKVDFSGFKQLIDIVGGVDFVVDQPFTDEYFPITGKEDDFCGGDPTFACRYEKIHFDRGLQHMDGETALKYIRSRYATGEEGTDFARSRRQQQVMIAFKDKVWRNSFWEKPAKIKMLIDEFNNATKTDMNWSEKISFLKFFLRISDSNIRHLILDTGNEEKNSKGFLINPPTWQYNGTWVLVPRTGDFQEIQKYISCKLQDLNCQLQP